jgi:type 1 fimbria pilin
MKKLRMILSAFAFVFAITAAFGFAQQVKWFKPVIGAAQQGTITVPVNTDLQPCLIQAGTQCKIGTRDAYETQDGANTQDPSQLLRYN